MSKASPISVAEIIKLWPNSEAFGEDLGLRYRGAHARIMKMRGSIPRKRWDKVLEAAKRRQIPLDKETLEAAHRRTA